jgi:hypothetical protein
MYGKVIDHSAAPHQARPSPIGRGPTHDKVLYRDQANPWRYGTPDSPPPDAYLEELRAEMREPRVPWWEQ